MTIQDLRVLYHDGIIPKDARGKIGNEFMQKFKYKSKNTFYLLIELDSNKVPLPDVLQFLTERITFYHNYYTHQDPSMIINR